VPARAGNRRASPASTARSAQFTRGRVTPRRSTATSWRSISSSAFLAAELRASNASHRSAWQNSKYSSRSVMRRSSWPHGLFDQLAAQHPRSTFWHPQGRHSAASSRVRQSSASRLRLPGRPPTCPMTQCLGPSGWRWRRTDDHMPARSGRFPPTRLNTNADRWSARACAWYCLGGYGGNVVMFRYGPDSPRPRLGALQGRVAVKAVAPAFG
jgi:hypothetical protein